MKIVNDCVYNKYAINRVTKYNIIYVLLNLFIFINIANIGFSVENDVLEPKQMDWPFNGINGKFDRQSIQRGFKVYKEVCSVCHSVNYLTFRNLSNIGYTEEQIKTIASEYSVQDGPNDEGDMYTRPGKPSDHIPGPFVNEKAARASNNGALPPDLSLIVKAREDGVNYVHSLLNGFVNPPDGFVVGENMHYNPYFIAGGRQLAMPPPLVAENQVTFDDGTESTIDQMSKDVVNFLQWVAEPEMEDRKRMGLSVILFLVVFTVMFYFAKKRIWKRVK